jgi:TRAP-type C4-dicarboxylate transport system substrate-binding protein
MRLLRWLNSIALIGVPALPSGAALAQIKWDLASANPPTNFQTINLDKFIEDVEKRTNGALKITHHPNASLFKMNEIRRATQRGQVAIGSRGRLHRCADGVLRPAVRAMAIAEMTMRPSTNACLRAVRCTHP